MNSVDVVFRPKRYKLFCLSVYLHRDNLYRIHEIVFLCEDQSDDLEISSKYPFITYDQTN